MIGVTNALTRADCCAASAGQVYNNTLREEHRTTTSKLCQPIQMPTTLSNSADFKNPKNATRFITMLYHSTEQQTLVVAGTPGQIHTDLASHALVMSSC